jgi:hypothetical protein
VEERIIRSSTLFEHMTYRYGMMVHGAGHIIIMAVESIITAVVSLDTVRGNDN